MKLKEMLEASKLKSNILKIVLLVLFMSVFNSLSYAYFTSNIEGKGNEMALSTSDISIRFQDSEAIKKTGLTPGSTIIKTFTITNNSEASVKYKINWEYLINNFVGRANLVYKVTGNNSGGNLSETQLPDSEEHINILNNLTINAGVTQTYTMTITYKDNGQNQDLDKNKSLIGKLEVTDINGNSILPETSTGSSSSPVVLDQNLYGMTVKKLMNEIYPVGSVYISFENTNPSEKFGGKWERVDKGKTLVNVDENDTTFASANITGGSKTTTLTTDNLPKHSHNVTATGNVNSVFTGSSVETSSSGAHTHKIKIRSVFSPGSSSKWLSLGFTDDTVDMYPSSTEKSVLSAGTHTHTLTASGTVDSTFTGTSTKSSEVGKGTSFSNLSPYITVYMWKRVS